MSDTATATPLPAVEEKSICYLIPCQGGIAMSALNGRPSSILGEPITYCWQEVTYPGNFINASRGVALSVTPERQVDWVKKIKDMNEAGLDIPVVCGFGADPHIAGPHENYGKVVDARIKGGRLQVEMALIGDEARKLAARNKPSVLIPSKPFIDGKGRKWDDFIAHVCLTDAPVLPDLGLPVAASMVGTNDFIAMSFQGASLMTSDMMPSADSSSTTSMGSGMQNMPVSDACMSELHANVPGLMEKPMPQKADHILNHVKSMGGMAKNIAAPVGAGGADGYSFTKDELIQTNVAAMSFSRKVAAARSPESRAQRISDIRATKDRAVAAGAITPAIADKLFSRLVGDPDKGVYNDMAMSLVATVGNDGVSLAMSIFSDLADNKPVAMGQVTGQQAAIGADGTVTKDAKFLRTEGAKKILEMAGASAAPDPVM